MKFFIDNIVLFAMALISAGMLLWPGLQRRGAKVSILQATQMLNQGKTLLLDVREEAEFAAGIVHLEGKLKKIAARHAGEARKKAGGQAHAKGES